MRAIVLSVAQAKAFTKTLIALLTTVGALMAIKPVNDFVTAHLLAPHPRLAPVLACFLGVCALLHEPKVQQIIGVEIAGKPCTES